MLRKFRVGQDLLCKFQAIFVLFVFVATLENGRELSSQSANLYLLLDSTQLKGRKLIEI